MTSTLLPQHAKMIAESAITPEVAAERSYWSATKKSELEALGFKAYQCSVPALVVPIRDATGRVALYQIRPDRPRTTEAGRELKYETPAGAHLVLDIPTATREKLDDPKVPLWITEGSRKVDAAVSAGLACIGVLGVFGWRGTNEKDGKTVLADWESIALNGREVFIAFDSDVMTKEAVSLACAALRRFLQGRQAHVRLVYLPSGESGEKVGLDDYFAAGHSVDDLLSHAPKPSQEPVRERAPSRVDREVAELVEMVTDALFPFPHDSTVEKLFRTAAGEPFAVVAPTEALQTVAIRSTAFRNFLAAAYYKQKARAPSREALANARYVLEGKALFEAPEIEVFTRVARGPDGAIYLDLGDADWSAVRIDAAGWNVIPRPPVRFRRAGGMLALPRPTRGGSVESLRKFMNVEKGHGDFALVVGWIVASLRDRGPYPILILQGEQGSAKSTLTRVCRRLIDPNKADLRAMPRESRDLAITANNSWTIALDNTSDLPAWLSDGLCRLATGGGFATRALYTDSDEMIFDAMRPILLNGIDSVATRGDFLDRAIVLSLPRLEGVREEKDFWSDFAAEQPAILGALLDAVSLALQKEDETKLAERVRMADAARWIVAAEPALPWEVGTFLRAYASNRADSNAMVLEASPVAAVVASFVTGRIASWEGTARELLAALDKQAPDPIKKLRSWPRTPRALSSALRRLAPNLRAAGIVVELGHREGGRDRRRIISLALPADDGIDRPHRPHRPPDAESVDAASTYPADDGADGADANEEPSASSSADRPQLSPRDSSSADDADDADDDFGPAPGWEL